MGLNLFWPVYILRPFRDLYLVFLTLVFSEFQTVYDQAVHCVSVVLTCMHLNHFRYTSNGVCSSDRALFCLIS